MLGFLRYSAIGCSWAYSALLLGACSGPPTVRVGRIVIDAPRSFDAASEARESIRAGVRARLEEDRSSRFTPDDREATHVLHLRIIEGDGAEDGDADAGREGDEAAGAGSSVSRPRYVVQIRLRPMGTGSLFETVAPVRGRDRIAGTLAAFDDAWAILSRERELDTKNDATLIATLADPDPRLRDFAIVRLGDRKSREAVMPLCERLQKEERGELILRAIGTLVAIGDARAVEPIIELSNRREPDFVLQVVYAVGAIGGRTAEAYLVTMASGHPVESVRRGAEQALSEMKRSSGKR